MDDLRPSRRSLNPLVSAALTPILLLCSVFGGLPASAQVEIVPRAAILGDAGGAALRPVVVQDLPVLPALPAPTAISAGAVILVPAAPAVEVFTPSAAAPASAPALAPEAVAPLPVRRGASGKASASSSRRRLEAAPAEADLEKPGVNFDGDAAAAGPRDAGAPPVKAGMLGKKAPVRDPRTLLLAKYVSPRFSGAPAQADFSGKVKAWGMMLNDKIGDCTVAACGHQIQQWTANAGSQRTPSDAEILSAYEKVSGYRRGDQATDDGADLLDVMKYWRKSGIGGHKIGAFASVDPGNFDHLRAAVWIFGGAVLGLALPQSARDQDVWDVPAGGAAGLGKPDSWGGHAVEVAGFGPRGVLVVTWGVLKWMTWDFLKAYCEEAYALISKDFLVDGATPNNGFDLARLKADLKTVSRGRAGSRKK